MATPLGSIIFFRNKEMMPQCNGQNAGLVTVENLVIHFDQEKFEELLSGGNPTLHARKHRRVSIAKAPVATEQKSTKTISIARAIGRTSLQFPSVSTKTEGILCEAKQVPREPKTAQGKQVWMAKQTASPREALGKVEA